MVVKLIELTFLCVLVVWYFCVLRIYFKYALCDEFLKGLLYFLFAVMGGFYLVVFIVAFVKGGLYMFPDVDHAADLYIRKTISTKIIEPVIPTKKNDPATQAAVSCVIGLIAGAVFAVVVVGVWCIQKSLS